MKQRKDWCLEHPARLLIPGHPHPEVVAALGEIGVDASALSGQLLTAELAAPCALLVTMGCGEKCPYVPGLRRIDWALEDPKGKDMAVVREIRETIRQRVKELVEAEGWGR